MANNKLQLHRSINCGCLQFPRIFRWQLLSYRKDQVYHAEKMLKVSDIARLKLAKFMDLYLKFKVPNLLITENYFTPVNEIHSYNTRSSSSKCYFLPSVNTTAGKRSLLFRGTKLWNAIPVDIKQYPYHKFVKYYKIYFIHKYQN